MPSTSVLFRGAFLARLLFIVLAVALAGWVVLDAGWIRLVTNGPGSDVWEHVAAIAAWIRDPLNPAHPHLGDATASPRFIPLYFPIVLVAYATNLDPLGAYGLSMVLHGGLFLVGVWWFCRVHFRSDWTPAVALVVLLSFWGIGWGWSNAYDLRAFLLTAGYPSLGVFALTFILWAWLGRILGEAKAPSGGARLGIALVVAVMVVSHPPTAFFALTGGAAMLLLSPGTAWPRRFMVLGLLGLGGLLAFAWPFFPFHWLIMGGETGMVVSPLTFLDRPWAVDRVARIAEMGRGTYFYDPDQLVRRAGVGLLGLPALCVAAFLPRFRWLAVLASVMVTLFLVNMVVPVPLGHRFVFFALAAGHLALVAGADRFILTPSLAEGPSWRQWGLPLARLGLAIGLCAALVEEARFTAHAYATPWRRFLADADRPSPVVARLRALADILPSDAVVLSDPNTSFGLPIFKGTVVWPKRGTIFIKDRLARMRSERIFFAADTPADIRREILGAFQVSHVIVTEKDVPPDLLAFLDDLVRRGEGRELPAPEGDRMLALTGEGGT